MNKIIIKYSKRTQYSFLFLVFFLVLPFLNSTFATHGYLFILRIIVAILLLLAAMLNTKIICGKEIFAIIDVCTIYFPFKDKHIYLENITDVKIVKRESFAFFPNILKLEITYVELVKGKEKQRKLVIPEGFCNIDLVKLKEIILERKY